MFDGEYWRIIGVFDHDTHGREGENLVKIIRDNPIGSLSWNVSNSNNWSLSSIRILLNDYYYLGKK